MRGRGIVAAAAATALLAGVVLRARSPRAPRPESESEVPAQAVEPPPSLDRMPTLAARPRPPPALAPEADAIVGEAAEGARRGRPRGGRRARSRPCRRSVFLPWTPPDALLPAPRPDVDPSWPLFTEDEAGRRHAMRRGLRALDRLGRLRTEGAVWAADRIRRDLTEGIFLPCARPAGARGLEARIAGRRARLHVADGAVRRDGDRAHGPRGLPVPDRGGSPFGSNTVLFWNLRGSLDPRRMPAGEIVLPLEPLVLLADRETRALHLLLGDAWGGSSRSGSARTARRRGRGGTWWATA